NGTPIVDAVICISPFSLLVSAGESLRDEDNFLRSLTGVPVFQTMLAQGDFLNFADMRAGADRRTISSFTAWAELDGQIDCVPIGCMTRDAGGNALTIPLPERIDHLSRLVRNWSDLRRKENKDKRIAVVLYQKLADCGRIGSAAGLDCAGSVIGMLKRLESEGYTVGDIPENGRALLDILISRVSNCLDSFSEPQIRETSADIMDGEIYKERFGKLPEFNRGDMAGRWGEPPGNQFVLGDGLIIPGTAFGNVLVTVQPLRSWDDPDRMYHDPVLPPHHQYLAFYQWLRDVFRADAVIHLGTHGSLEWLPGKNTGLSCSCYPDIALDCLPDIYPYIIDNPGEGVQAKRRSEAVLDGYGAPAMTRSELGGAMNDLDDLVREYLEQASQNRGRDDLLEKIRDKLREESIAESLKIDPDDPDLAGKTGTIADRLEEIRDTLIPYGLHIMGKPPEGQDLIDTIVSSLRVRGDCGDSLRDAVSSDFCLDRERDIEKIESLCGEIVSRLYESGFDENAIPDICDPDSRTGDICRFVCDTLVPSLLRTDMELETITGSLGGKYIVPGPPGALSRGQTNALPTGRNTYGLDPDA
ncbi:MAG: cobaltochelatase subunit CobN, partial [Candidatus Methanomethylophilaceae archaeon]|nr:cobaltochelatase subunit CobN [Candidatus Methanomethylophilaceae archaeon]